MDEEDKEPNSVAGVNGSELALVQVDDNALKES